MDKLPSDIWLDAIQPYLTISDKQSMILTQRRTAPYIDALTAPSYHEMHQTVLHHHSSIREWAERVETYTTCIGWAIVIASGITALPMVPLHMVHMIKWVVCILACPMWWYLIRRVDIAHRLAIARPRDWKQQVKMMNNNGGESHIMEWMTTRCQDYIERRDATGYLYPMLAMAIARCWYLFIDALHIVLQYWFLCCSDEHSAGTHGDGALLPILHRHRHNRAGVGRRRRECAATVRNIIMLVYSMLWPLTFLSLTVPQSWTTSGDDDGLVITTLDIVVRYSSDMVAACFTIGSFVACLGAHIWVMYDLNRAATEARHHDDHW